MSEIHKFISNVTSVANGGGSESTQRELIGELFERYVSEASQFYATDEHPDASVRNRVRDLQNAIGGEINLKHPGILGVLIDHAHEVVANWLRRNKDR